MKNLITFVVLFALNLLFVNQIAAQIKGLFEKEDPAFQATVIPTADEGTVMLVYYFTHSKITQMDISVWLRDQGTSLASNGSNRLIRGLQGIGNRQQDTVYITGLQNMHFYTFGVDYKQETLVSAKFESKVLQSGYRYEYQSPVLAAKGNNQPAAKPFEKEELFTNNKTNSTSKTPANKAATNLPCNNPNVFVQIEQQGYCGAENRPAVLVQCNNCDGQNWDFSVELMNSNTNTGWFSLRTDGKMQPASGNSIRTEPICTVGPGVYYARVVALGENCTMPVIHNVGTPIVIKNAAVTNDFTEKSPTPRTPYPTENYGQSQKNTQSPDTCVVMARANLYGDILRGTIELALNSPCASLNPYTEIHYIHPGYRDITTNQIALRAGAVAPFEIKLDDRDLNRKIHTIQVVTYIKPSFEAAPVAVSAFWIRANADQMMASSGVKNSGAIEDDLYIDPAFTQDIETISVTASDPNCTPIQDLSLIYLSGQSDKPLYMSWINPRCCQSEGCTYSIWTGETPDRLRILVEGSKRGAVIKEIMQDMLPTDRYIELVINTKNGTRKAAYVLGEGPKYGFEEIMAYRDRLKPQKSDELVASKEVPADMVASIDGQPDAMIGGDLTARGLTNSSSTVTFEQPKLSVEDFAPCKYKRETMVVGNRPAEVGDEVKIQYDFTDKAYRYTLYFQPNGATEWVVAPGTTEQQRDPRFDLTMMPYHAGKYVILAKKANANWGCLASSLEDAVELKVKE